jgi:heat-inducible transcriptional repressor
MQDWPELAAAVLAEMAGNVSVVTEPRASVTRIRHLELVSLQPRLALLILVTLESNVRQLMVHLPEEADQPMLSAAADELSSALRGKAASEIAYESDANSAIVRAVIEQIVNTLAVSDAAKQTAVRASGMENILGQPDLGELDVQSVLELVYGGGILNALVPNLKQGSNVQVFIGDDRLPGTLKRLGVIVATYGVENQVTGLIGVVGPTRMSYWRTISTVRYMSTLINDLVTELYPGGQ